MKKVISFLMPLCWILNAASLTAAGVVLTKQTPSESEAYWKPIEFGSIENYPTSVVITPKGTKQTSTITRYQIGVVIEFVDLNATSIVSEDQFNKFKAARDSLAGYASQCKQASGILSAVVQNYDQVLRYYADGNVLIAGKWISKHDYEAKLKAEGLAAKAGLIPEFVSGAKTFKNVRVTKVVGDRISIMHEGGIASMLMADLTESQVAMLKVAFPGVFAKQRDQEGTPNQQSMQATKAGANDGTGTLANAGSAQVSQESIPASSYGTAIKRLLPEGVEDPLDITKFFPRSLTDSEFADQLGALYAKYSTPPDDTFLFSKLYAEFPQDLTVRGIQNESSKLVSQFKDRLEAAKSEAIAARAKAPVPVKYTLAQDFNSKLPRYGHHGTSYFLYFAEEKDLSDFNEVLRELEQAGQHQLTALEDLRAQLWKVESKLEQAVGKLNEARGKEMEIARIKAKSEHEANMEKIAKQKQIAEEFNEKREFEDQLKVHEMEAAKISSTNLYHPDLLRQKGVLVIKGFSIGMPFEYAWTVLSEKYDAKFVFKKSTKEGTRYVIKALVNGSIIPVGELSLDAKTNTLQSFRFTARMLVPLFKLNETDLSWPDFVQLFINEYNIPKMDGRKSSTESYWSYLAKDLKVTISTTTGLTVTGISSSAFGD